MRSFANPILVVLILALGATPVFAKDPPVPQEGSIAEGRHFKAICHLENERVARAALAAAEGAWRPAKELLAIRDRDIPEPLGIRLFRTPDDFDAMEKTVTGGRFARNNAFSSWDRREAFVAMEPAYSDRVLERVGLTVQTRRNLTHEAAHLLVYHAIPTFRYHPRWFAEGLAIWIADVAMTGSKRVDALVGRPFASMRLWRFRTMVEQGRLPPAERVLKEQYPELGFNDRYSLWWGFTRYLLDSRHAQWFRMTIRDAGSMSNSSAFRGEMLARFKRRFDGDLTRLDEELAAFGRALEPRWQEPLRTLSIEGDVWAHLAFTNNAVAWRTERAGPNYMVRGHLEFLPVDDAQMNVLIGKSDAGFVSIALQPTGGVTVFRYRSRTKEWVRFGYAKAEALTGSGRIPFAVAVEDDVLEVSVAGKRVHRITMDGIDLSGPWGVGVQANTAGLWHGVRIDRR